MPSLAVWLLAVGVFTTRAQDLDLHPVWTLPGYTTGIAVDVAVSGNFAYVADYEAGLQVIDISNPARPIRTGGYVPLAGVGLEVFDLSNSTRPQNVARYETTGFPSGADASRNLIFLSHFGAGLEVLDISNPTNPSALGKYDTTGRVMNVAVSGIYTRWTSTVISSPL